MTILVVRRGIGSFFLFLSVFSVVFVGALVPTTGRFPFGSPIRGKLIALEIGDLGAWGQPDVPCLSRVTVGVLGVYLFRYSPVGWVEGKLG